MMHVSCLFTFVEVSCLFTGYQEVTDSRQIVLNPQDTLRARSAQVSTLVFQEQSTLPLSDACSKSVNIGIKFEYFGVSKKGNRKIFISE